MFSLTGMLRKFAAEIEDFASKNFFRDGSICRVAGANQSVFPSIRSCAEPRHAGVKTNLLLASVVG